MAFPFWRWLLAFTFTQIVEVPIYRIPLCGRTWVAFGASAITHPVVWFLFPMIPHLRYWQMLFLAELFAVAVEAAYLRLFRSPNPLLWSVAANGASSSLGMLSRLILGLP
jgi:hypothetical protein